MKSCPDCRLFLSPFEWRNVQLMVCQSCGGCWADGAAAPTLLSGLLADLGELDVALPSLAAAPALEGVPVPCPDCAARTLPRADVVPGRLAVARCDGCGGLWLRSGERTALSGRAREVLAPAPPAPTPDVAETSPGAGPSAASFVEPAPVVYPQSAARIEPAAERRPANAAEAVETLLAGNARFAQGASVSPNTSPARRAEVLGGQEPFVAMLACSDSRVPPEILFDRGIGDIFVVRTAGASLTASTRASLLYAVNHLETPLVVVLGHTQCGAVRATIEDSGRDPLAEPLIKPIRAAVARARSLPGDLADNAAREHAIGVAAALRAALLVTASTQRADPPTVACMMYDIATGRVEVVPLAEPEQTPPPAATAVEPAEPRPTLDEALVPPGNVAESRFPRWCPKCRKGYDVATGFCTSCGVLLVEPWFRVKCHKCHKENLIGLDRCWSCRADLHPSFLTTRKPPSLRAPGPAGGSGQTGCSTGVVMLAALALATALMGVLWVR